MAKEEYKFEETLEFLVGTISNSFSRKLARNFKQAGYDVTVEQWSILRHLWQEDGINQQSLSCSTGRDKPSVTRLVNNMENNDLLVRVPCPSDKRANNIYLTKKGKALREPLTSISLETHKDVIGKLKEKDLEVCKETLWAVLENLK